MSGAVKGPSRSRKPKTGLTVEEQDLWDHTAASMTPLRRAKDRVLDGADDAVFEPVQVATKRGVKAAEAGATLLPGLPARPVMGTAAKAVPKTPELSAFDRKSARRIRAGHILIDARLDLHGMYQAEAHGALRRFLVSCHGNGARWVLIITGKGAPRRTSWFADDGEPFGGHDGNRDGHRDEPRGVLRRNVPRWLSEPELRAIVVSYTQAAIGHGGDGAIYVQLRKRG